MGEQSDILSQMNAGFLSALRGRGMRLENLHSFDLNRTTEADHGLELELELEPTTKVPDLNIKGRHYQRKTETS